MSTYRKEAMLFQTFIELDTQISSLSRRISLNRFIEIGDDPTVTRDIENALFRIYNKVRSIESYFDLAVTPLSRANTYFSLIKRVNDTLKFVQEVRKKDYGSMQHTRELLERLNDCTSSLYEISDGINTSMERVH